MNRTKIIAEIIAVPVTAAMLLCGCSEGNNSAEVTSPAVCQEISENASESVEDVLESISGSDTLECRYYNENDFLLYDSRGEKYPVSGEVLCGVVPHHLTAGHMIAGFFKAAAESRPEVETVVIIAPMHYPADNVNTLCTSDTDWASPYGRLETDREISSLFKDKLGAPEDDEMMQYDHSASAHIPFVKYYFPEAKSACLLVSPKEKEDFPQRLAEVLAEAAEIKSCLFVFSIDFSHYLTPQEADMHDSETLEAVLAGNTAAIEKMTDDNVDSPYCLSTYVRLTEMLGGKITAADNSNTSEVREIPYSGSLFPEGVTSYFVYISEF
ncbi:MAG: AmmeMemoRadiSam system protein B [Oscillospiraceae bacterium]|nr:AmmeMemoRadiSam system protein B [Oscillospiraceae bacterium]